MKNNHLKLFISFSLGAHLFFLSAGMVLFPDLRIDRFQIPFLEVSIIPLTVEEEKPTNPAKGKKELRSSELKARDEENKAFETANKREMERKPDSLLAKQEEGNVSEKEKKELLPPVKEIKPEPVASPPIQSEVKVQVTLLEEPKPLPAETKKRDSEVQKNNSAVQKNGEPVSVPPVEGGGKAVSDSGPKRLSVTPSGQEAEENQGERALIVLPARSAVPDDSSLRPQVGTKGFSAPQGEVVFVQPRYVENPKPSYPQEARRRGVEGEVRLRVEVLSDGRVGQAEVRDSSGHEILDRAALTTVKQWRFIPAKKGGDPIPVWVNIPIKFQLR